MTTEDIHKGFNCLSKHEIDNSTICTIAEHEIETGNEAPVAVRNHRIPKKWEEKLDEQVQLMYKNGIIIDSNCRGAQQ